METLRDKNGRVIGTLRTSGDVTKLYNAGGRMMGYYDKSSNTTFDSGGAVIAKCNLLVSLLKN